MTQTFLRNALALVAKDLWQQRWFVPMLVAFQVISAAVMFVQAPRAPMTTAIVFQLLCWVGAFVLCFRSVISEEKNRGFVFIATLPVSRREIVCAKFAANAVMVTVTFGAFAGALAAASGLGYLPWPTRDSGLVLATFAALTLSANALFLTVALMGDSEKTIWVPFPLIWVASLLMGQSQRLSKLLSGAGVTELTSLMWLTLAACIAIYCALTAITAFQFIRRTTIG